LSEVGGDASPAYKRYLLGVLLVIQTFSYADGLALGLALQSIKRALALTDTQLGLLSGIAFAAFYSIMGLPIARWADRGNRVTIISLTALAWSVMVALCSSATSFGQLLLLRMGVAIGESGCVPPANSLIADYFARAERPRATAIYMLGPSLSMIVGYVVAGWVNELYGWRIMFLIVGLPGLLPAALAWFTLREPRRAGLVTPVGDVAPCLKKGADVGTIARTLWRQSTFRHLLFFFSVAYFFGYGILQWQPTFFVRSYGLDTGALGTWFALVYGVAGALGTYCGGVWAGRFAPRDERLQLRAMAVVYAAYGAVSALVYLAPNAYAAFALMALAAFGSATTIGPLFATIQTLVPSDMRATAVAVVYLFANLVGLGIGPLAAGALSDALRPLVGEESLRYALLALTPGYLWCGWHLWCAGRTIREDLHEVHDE